MMPLFSKAAQKLIDVLGILVVYTPPVLVTSMLILAIVTLASLIW